MQDAGIFNDDILLVDRSLAFKDGDIVVAEIKQEFTVKYLFTSPVVRLVPANDDYPTLYLNECDELNVFGVVATSIHRLRD